MAIQNKNLLIFGPPGAGKGTQSKTISEYLKIPHISTGDMFRYHIKNDTELGKKAKEYSNAGKLVPDEVTIAMVEERISREDAQGGFLLDGFPRNVSQSVALEKILAKTGRSIGMILNLDVPLEEVKNRLAKRAAIEGRSDDADPKVIQKRIETYVSESAPCLDYYKPSGKVKTIDGTATIEQVWSSLKACF
jgi:adenylate kinase